MDSGTIDIQESDRAKHLRITVHPDGRVVVTKPARVSQRAVDAFVRERASWIADALAAIERRAKRNLKANGGKPPAVLPKPRKDSQARKDAIKQARELVRERLIHFNTHYGFSYGTIAIRNQKTRWGSCSADNNLNFNYRLAFLPPHLADYIIVHELCHTREHNHSPRFWALVAQTIPDHEARRKAIHAGFVL
jgi:hypothetical protein